MCWEFGYGFEYIMHSSRDPQKRMYVLCLSRAAFSTKTIRIGDHSILFQIWDTAGQEKVGVQVF